MGKRPRVDITSVEMETMRIADSDNPSDPVWCGQLFVLAVRGAAANNVSLTRLTTKESAPAWGDFAEAPQLFAAIGCPAFGVRASYPNGYPDFAYLYACQKSTHPSSGQGTIVAAAGVLTALWNSDQGL